MANLGKITISKNWVKLDGIQVTNINGTTSALTVSATETYSLQNVSAGGTFIVWDGATIPADGEFGGTVVYGGQIFVYEKGANDLYLRAVSDDVTLNLRDNL